MNIVVSIFAPISKVHMTVPVTMDIKWEKISTNALVRPIISYREAYVL